MGEGRVTLKVLLLAALGVWLALGIGCSRDNRPLVVYAGKGLDFPLEEVRQTFEQQHKIPLTIIYGGSDTLLSTIQKTRTGDLFIPGSTNYLPRAGKLVKEERYVADHLPAFAVRADNPKNLQTFSDLLAHGVKIAVGNKDMCAIGKIAETIISASDQQAAFRNNIVITGTTVNELIKLVADREVDTALIWADMLEWPEGKELRLVEIPAGINKPEEIRVAVLTTSAAPQRAKLFADFLATEGKAIFVKHGFGVK
ncbi:MAG: molybdate ABC transporter substrate-binding protein [Desulfobulbaceae bacterium]|nr:molybdate ABC transporter substrate-binding protein [Desulfobulbaceae bacterium]